MKRGDLGLTLAITAVVLVAVLVFAVYSCSPPNGYEPGGFTR